MPTAIHDSPAKRFLPKKSERDPLDPLFAPKSVAIVGASETERSVGRAIVENLSLFPGSTYLVNPNHSLIFGRQTFPTVHDIPERPDLAVIATPAHATLEVIQNCVEAGVSTAVILSAGFKECGAEGAALEKEILAEARKGGLRLLGPNCLGIMTPRLKFNATFASRIANTGSVAFLSQSGALCAAVLDWSFDEKIGFSGFASVGSMLDLGWGDLIDYFGADPNTKSIVCYMESIGDARSFMSAAREVSLTKPIIVLKVGHTDAGAKAAASHTGALTGSDAVLDAAFRRAGVLRVNTLDELFDMAEVLGKQPRVHGPRLAIVTNAGGPAALATDMLLASGGQLAPLSKGTIETLNNVLPAYWSHSNPVDVLGDADASRFRQAIEIVAADPASDAILTILTPQAVTDPVSVAAEICECAKAVNKPFLASWMGGASVADGDAMLNAAHIPTFKTPDDAARAFALMWQYNDNLRALYETPDYSAPDDSETSARAIASEIIRKVRSENRTLLTVIEAAKILQIYGIPVVESCIAETEADAVEAGEETGFPVAVKLHSKTITHKSDVGGVVLNVGDPTALRSAWRNIRENVSKKADVQHFNGVLIQPMIQDGGVELILGSSVDSQFGPTLLFGTGGKFVEVYNDTAIGLPPLNSTLARRLIEQTHVASILKGNRDAKPADNRAIEQAVVAFSRLVVELPSIAEIDINPLLANADGVLALDFRILLHSPSLDEAGLPRPAIRPYPSEYIFSVTLKDGTHVTLRPIRAEDEPLMVNFHQTLSDRSVYMRYFTPFKLDQRIAHTRLTRVCLIDYDREMALVAEHHANGAPPHIVGIARLSRAHRSNEAEFSVLVSDEWQGQGLGTELLRRIIQIGKDFGLNKITATILEDNCPMQRLAAKCGFILGHKQGECTAELVL